jgi:hypothetical protein
VLGAGCPAISDGCNSAPLVPKSGKEALAKGAMLVGAAAVGFGGAALLEAVAGTAAEAAEVEVSSGPMQAMERQLARDGPKSVQSTIKTLTKNIAEHESKIAEAAQRGGNTSSMEREIRAWQETLKAAQKVLEKNP